jgi:NAD(P)-dependent dehydrogenase (short-subunit alcohol dehydrogenase family)
MAGCGGGMASVGFYGAGKAALDALSGALAMEVERFGVHVTNLQMGGYATELFTSGTTTTTPDPAYQELRKELAEMWGDDAGPAPETAAPVVLRVAALADPPRRLVVGSASFDVVRELSRLRDDQYARWEDLSRQAPG